MPDIFKPVYLETYEKNLFGGKIQQAFRMLENCEVCPRKCGVNRHKENSGFCQAGYFPEVASCAPHYGEEKPLVGRGGSGTIFLSHGNLGCLFCQNYSISHLGEGQTITFEDLSRMMIKLHSLGCHNINFVTPSHFVPQILKSLPIAIEAGLDIPLVYNSGGYDSVQTLKILEGVFDIYMPDLKFLRDDVAQKYAQAEDYPHIVRKAIKEMYSQVGDLKFNSEGIAQRGLLVRHLVLPDNLAGTQQAMHFLATEISPQTYVNIMDQYHPWGDIPPGSPLSRRITPLEFHQAIESARQEGLERLDKTGFFG